MIPVSTSDSHRVASVCSPRSDWLRSGAWDDPRIAFAIYAPLRFHLWNHKRPGSTTDLGFRLTPGLLAGSAAFKTPTVVSRIELAVPVSVDVNPKLSVVTGGVIPIDLGWVKGSGFGG